MQHLRQVECVLVMDEQKLTWRTFKCQGRISVDMMRALSMRALLWGNGKSIF